MKKSRTRTHDPLVEYKEYMDRVLVEIVGVPRTLFNIGVGQPPHNEARHFVARFPEINVFGLEPLTKSFIQQAPGYPGHIYPWGLWSTAGFKKLQRTTDQGNSSLMLFTPALGRRMDRCGEDWIYCTTLDTLDKLVGCPKDIFLWMDIEGAEVEALKGGLSLLASGRVRWIFLEVGIVQRRIGEPTQSEVEALLGALGFKPTQKSLEYMKKSRTMRGRTHGDMLFVHEGNG